MYHMSLDFCSWFLMSGPKTFIQKSELMISVNKTTKTTINKKQTVERKAFHTENKMKHSFWYNL